MSQKKQMFILRGLPGSGKSYWQQQNHPDAVVASADKYFLTDDGRYVFDPAEIGEAHTFSYKTAILAVLDGKDVVIDNTNISRWEMTPYIQLGRAYDYDVQLIHIDTAIGTCLERNTHEVPKETIERMHKSFEAPLPFDPPTTTYKV